MLILASLGSWLPFAIVGLFIIFLSIIFTLRYQQNRDRDCLVTLVCSISLIIALLTSSLLPTDVILVSFMKNPNGTFKEWTSNQTTRDHIQKYVEVGYYVLYGLVILMAFLVNPFLFFYYEEKEEQEETSKRVRSAIKWTIGFLIFLIILIILGIFVPQLATLPTDNSTSEWDHVKYLIDHFDSSIDRGLLEFLLLTIYTGYGSIACPLSLIRGKRSARLQQTTIEEQRSEIQNQIRILKTRYPRHVPMPVREKRKLAELEQHDAVLCRNEESIINVRQSFCFKCRYIYRPIQIILGILLFCFALLIFISLLLSNINKCINFINFKQIFAQGNQTLPNPIDIVLTWTGKFYPISYIFLSGLMIYIILTSLYGLQQIGIWYFWIRDERILFHYNGHGVPRPTANGEIWVFNKNFTQYIPLSLYDLQKWMSSPSIYVFDCSHAGVVLNLFVKFAEQIDKELEDARRNIAQTPFSSSTPAHATGPILPLLPTSSPIHDILLGACGENELLPMNPELPADLFTSCLTTPIRIALRWYVLQKNISRLNPNIDQDMIDKIPGTVTDRKSMLGELNWIFTAVTDTIAWNSLPKDTFQRLFRQDLLVASLFRNFLLAERIMRSYGCHVCSRPALPPMFEHRLWNAWDMALDLCLKQLPSVLKQTESGIREPIYEPSSFFADQLTAFSVWLGENSLLTATLEKEHLKQPEQLPIVLQVLLSQSHRQRALDLLARFLDIGTWAVHLALSVGIFPYVLRLLQATSDDLRPYLVFIWAKILAVDRACQIDIIREKGHEYFISTLTDVRSSNGVRALAAFNLTCLVDNYTKGQDELLPVMSRVLDILNTPTPYFHETSALFLWSTLFLGQAWRSNANACEKAVLIRAPDTLQILLTTHDSPEVRAACAYALGTYLSSSTSGNELSERRSEQSKEAATVLMRSLHDGSPLVRQEVLVALHHFLNLFTQTTTTSGTNITSNVNRTGSLLYKTVFDKVTEAIQTVASSDPSHEMVQLAETILTHLQQPVSTTFFQWCCSRFRVSNTITRDLGSGIAQQLGASYSEDEDDCFARSGRYWRNYCIRSNPSRLADFQHMRETIFNSRISSAAPLVLCLHPYENYLAVANLHGNLNFYEFDGTPRSKSTLKVGSVGSTINTLDFINAHDRTLICVGTDTSAIRIFDESTHRLISSWIALYDQHNHFHSSPHHHRLTTNPTATTNTNISTSPAKFVVDWNQQLCRIYASSSDIDYISLWDVERERCLYTMDTGTSGGVYCLISDSNGYCAAGLGDGTVRCFDTRSRENTIAIIPSPTSLNRHSPIIKLRSDMNDRLLSISNMGQLRRWDIETGISAELPVPQTSQHISAADVHLTGNVLALATSNALQFKTCFGDLLFDIKNSKFAQVSCLSFHQYRQLLAVGFKDGSLSMFTGKTNSSTV
ncbi:unnamed protein product [Rotaria sp. Silwood2]|nr:unnamed protein product [Rotaria sp. Silwood2]